MALKKLTDRVLYYPHQPETDRPMLAYIKGEKFSLAIDAGSSAGHVDEFYAALQGEGLAKPDFTVITHWHWDHTFGMHRIHGLSIAHRETNAALTREMARLAEPAHRDFLKEDDACLGREYAGGKDIVVVQADLEFAQELTLRLGGMTARIFHAQSPHSEDTALIYIPEEKMLFLGDSTSEDFYNNGYMDKQKLRALIDTIEHTDCTHCIVSHAEPLTKSDLLRYLESVL